MIKFMWTVLVIITGYIVAIIDWDSFFTHLVPKWDAIHNTPQLFVCLAVTLLSYFLFIYYPCIKLVESIEKREVDREKAECERNGTDSSKVGLRKISFR